MQHHFQQVTLAHEALIRGGLEEARKAAKNVAALAVPGGLTPALAVFVDRLRAAGDRASSAATVPIAATATAEMLATCGDCHRAAGTMPATPVVRRPVLGGLVGHMLDHQRAVDALVAGLVIPSTSSWQEGARLLRIAALKRSDLPADPKLTAGIAKAEATVHALADRASEARDAGTRTRLYGELVATCSSCHRLHGLLWGPRSGR
jgi:mono/diheme cytochrome c family protein